MGMHRASKLNACQKKTPQNKKKIKKNKKKKEKNRTPPRGKPTRGKPTKYHSLLAHLMKTYANGLPSTIMHP
jgi:hypothetical protein